MDVYRSLNWMKVNLVWLLFGSCISLHGRLLGDGRHPAFGSVYFSTDVLLVQLLAV